VVDASINSAALLKYALPPKMISAREYFTPMRRSIIIPFALSFATPTPKQLEEWN
jgi:hypothetical protein